MSAAVKDARLRGRTRWSMAARCARQAAFGLLGETPEEPDEETRLLFKRGQLDEQWFVEETLIPKYGRDGLQLQKAVEWGPAGHVIGELHPDAFVIADGMPVEIKSHADGDPSDFDYVQLAGEMHFDPDAGRASALVVIDRNLKWEAIPVMLTDERIEQVETIARQVAHAGITGELPDRVCEKPADGRGRLCPFVDVCFRDWTPPDAIEIDSGLAVLAADVYLLDEARKPLKKQAETADEAYKARAADLSEFDLQPGRVYQGAGVTIKRTAFPDSAKFSLKKAREAGLWTAEHDILFAPFIASNGGHDRWEITASDEAIAAARRARADAEFGDEAPWTAEDLDPADDEVVF